MTESPVQQDREQEDADDKSGISLADIVRVIVLGWSATLLTVSYLGIFPQMKMDSTFVASLLTGAMAGFGIERKSGASQKKQPPKIDSNTPSK